MPTYLQEVKSEWEASHILSAKEGDPITLDPDPINIDLEMSWIRIAGQEDIDIDEIDRFPGVLIFVTDLTPGTLLMFQQEEVEEDVMAAAIRVVNEGTNAEVLEKSIYRYTHAIYNMMRYDRFLSGLGWFVDRPAKHYSAIEPSEPLLKAGQVSFIVKTVSVAS